MNKLKFLFIRLSDWGKSASIILFCRYMISKLNKSLIYFCSFPNGFVAHESDTEEIILFDFKKVNKNSLEP